MVKIKIVSLLCCFVVHHPAMQNDQKPETVVEVIFSRQEFFFHFYYLLRIHEAIAIQHFFIKKFIQQKPKLMLQQLIERNGKSLLGSVEKFSRQVSFQDGPQNVFGSAVPVLKRG